MSFVGCCRIERFVLKKEYQSTFNVSMHVSHFKSFCVNMYAPNEAKRA